MKRLFTWLIIVLAFAGCSASWPSICPVVDQARRCKCAVITLTIEDHPTKASPPAGKITLDCDGTKLPVDVTAEQVDR